MIKKVDDYPRPQMRRRSYYLLNGVWDFAFDDENTGVFEEWYQRNTGDMKINVPFTYETVTSGIHDEKPHQVIWYWKNITIDERFNESEKFIINFEGCDYRLDFWLNGIYQGNHIGGYSRASFDIGKHEKGETLLVCVRVEDFLSEEIIRGKQRWLEHNYGCWYVQTTGIWKDVWLEQVPDSYIDKIKITPDIYEKKITLDVECKGDIHNAKLEAEISFGDRKINQVSGLLRQDKCHMEIDVYDKYTGEWGIELWSTESPNLYNLQLTLSTDRQETNDRIESYFGMREIRIRNGLILLNGQPLYQRLILDQGYWKESGLTPEGDEAILRDIECVKALGFNGVRKHQKTETDRFLYWCDVKGLLVWGEAPSFYNYSDYTAKQFMAEWADIVIQNYNHPCIITWTPLNESWGMQKIEQDKKQQSFSQAVYYFTKALDETRPVIANDGWEHTVSDILTLHDYEENGKIMKDKYQTRKEEIVNNEIYHNNFRSAYAEGYGYAGQPVIISEYGGIAFQDNDKESWGYGEKVDTEEAFLERFRELTSGIKSIPYICGYCYTQLTDVQQEKNGLLTEERRFKISPDKIKEINCEPEGLFWNKKSH